MGALREYHWSGIPEEAGTDAIVGEKIERILSSVKIGVIPDIQELFQQKLRIYLTEGNVDTRVLMCFEKCVTT